MPIHEWSRTHDPTWVYEAGPRDHDLDRALPLPRPGRSRSPNVPDDGPVILAPNHFSNMDHFFAGVYIRRQDPVHGQVAALRQEPDPRLHLQVRRRLPGPPRPPRRGGLHHRARDPRPRRLRADLRRGRSLAHRRARRGEARRRPAGARVRCAGGPGRDPRLARRARLEAAHAFRRSRSSTASRSSSRVVERRPASSSSRPRGRSSSRSRRCTRRSTSAGAAA